MRKPSSRLWKKMARGLSAGRVQSVAVRLVVEREREIREFDPEEYWRLIARFGEGDGAFEAEFARLDGTKHKLVDAASTRAVLERLDAAQAGGLELLPPDVEDGGERKTASYRR